MLNILIVEDDRDISELIEFNLKKEHLTSHCVFNGREALEASKKLLPQLIILDLMLPDMGGIEVCKNLKRHPELQHIPVLMLTAKSEEIDRIIGFEVGADDYLTKPFNVRELLLRVKAILKRSQGTGETSQSQAFSFGILYVNPDKFEVKVNEKATRLTALEFRLLLYLYENKGRVSSRENLLDRVWGYDADLYTRTVDTYVKRLREKLGEAGQYIETIRSMGYRFCEKP